jgi:hypothetical protein
MHEFASRQGGTDHSWSGTTGVTPQDLNNRGLLQPKTSKARLCTLQKKDR